jgi:hypothetical protein
MRQMAEASGVVELDDEEILLFIERNEAANTVGKTRACIPHKNLSSIEFHQGVIINYGETFHF